jgi:hypothetical protein
MRGESGGVVGNTHDKGAAILGDVVDVIWNGDADGVSSKVVVEDTAGAAFPTAAWIAEIAGEVLALGGGRQEEGCCGCCAWTSVAGLPGSGLKDRTLGPIDANGVDEIQSAKGHNNGGVYLWDR